MMGGQDQLIVRIADRLAVEDLIVRYAKARDTTDPDLYGEIFVSDASIHTGSGKLLSKNLQAILDKVATDQIRFNPDKQSGATSYAVMRHLVTNVDITLSGDTARSDYYVTTLAQNEAEKLPEIISVARNEDDYVKRDGRWWIIRSTLNFGWENEAMGKALKVGPYTPPEYRR